MDDEKKIRAGGWGCLVLVVLVITGGVFLFSERGADTQFTGQESALYSSTQIYNGQPVPNFTDRDAQRISKALAEQERNHGVCFGWQLEDGVTGDAQFGSSRGPDVRATSCSEWVEVRVGVGYTSASSSSFDAADISVAASSGIPQAAGITRDDFAVLGVDAAALIADPVSATGHAALALPLLLIEEGALEPVDQPAQQAGPSEAPRSLPPSGEAGLPSGTVVLLVVLGLGAVVTLVLGIRASRRN